MAAGLICVIDHSHVRADDDEQPPTGEPGGVYAIPPTSPDAPQFNDGVTIIDYDPNADPGSDPSNEVSGPNDNGKSNKLPGLAPDQIVRVSLQFGASKAGVPVQAFAPDGGQITSVDNNLVADQNGNISLTFQVGHQPGLYQLGLRDETNHEIGIRFWVLGSDQDDNPPVDLPPGP
jgi:hypothetical protein